MQVGFTSDMAIVMALLLALFVCGSPVVAARCFFGSWGFQYETLLPPSGEES